MQKDTRCFCMSVEWMGSLMRREPKILHMAVIISCLESKSKDPANLEFWTTGIIIQTASNSQLFLIASSLVHSGLKSGVWYWNLRRSPCSGPAYLRAVLFKRGHRDERGLSNPDIGKEVYSHPPLVSLIKCFPPSLLFLLIFNATGRSLFPDSDHPTMHWGLWSVSHN